MSLLTIVAEDTGVSRADIKRISEIDDEALEAFLVDLKCQSSMRGRLGTYNLYVYAMREAERRLSMAGARERFKRYRE